MHYHTALPYETTDEFLAGAAPFISGGLAQERAVLAITSREKAAALREMLGPAADAVDFASTDEWYMTQARAFSKFVQRARTTDESGGRGLCILTDPSVAHFDEEQVRRWVFVENAVNDVLCDMTMSVMCTYDLNLSGISRLQIEVSHPHMAAGREICASSRFIEPRIFNESAYAVNRSDVPSNAQPVFFNGQSLAELRAFIVGMARNLGLTPTKAADLVIAASEAAANAVEHGGGSGVARVWRSGSEVICEIVNPEGRLDNPGAGFATPSWAAERGRGIWIMRQLCEWVDLRAEGAGTNVRLHFRDQV